MRRERAAPSADRTANSLERDVARAKSRLATLAHAISNTKPTAPNNIQSMELTSATSASFMGVTRSGDFGLASSMVGWAAAYWWRSTTISALACSRFSPGFKRPNMLKNGLSGRDLGGIDDHSDGRVIHTSMPGEGNWKRGGRTPMMVYGVAARVIV